MELQDSDQRLQAIQDHQLDLIQAAHPEIAVTGADGTQPRRPGEPFGILFREGHLLVRADVADEVGRFLADCEFEVERAKPTPLFATRGPVSAVGSVTSARGATEARPSSSDRTDLDRAQSMTQQVPALFQVNGCEPAAGIPALAQRVREKFGPDKDGFPAASPRHVFYMTPTRVLCPATEPAEAGFGTAAYPAMRSQPTGFGSSVAVLDTGFIAAAAAHCHWLRGITDYDPDPLDKFDLAQLTDSPDGYIDPYTGHGTFIAGVIRRVAPASTVHVRRLAIDLRDIFANSSAYAADVVDEMHIPDHVRQAVWHGQKVISLSAGGPTLDNAPPLSFYGMRELLAANQATLIAAAGNDATADPFWPAAFDWATGVGALDAAMTGVAGYSNVGVNANVFAPGTDIVNAFACGDYECFQPPDAGSVRHFHGLASWSGTSFSTPAVAGMVAARMSAQGESAPVATAALLAIAQANHQLPGVGPCLIPEYADLGF
jgi:Subtilase family